ncbi:MAG: acyl-CoA mutase large subunit family protein [Bacteroidales bacterium]|nr:acyl-CoA mutase large subunit family protein [Bacteroidales bacterium]
MKEDKLFEQFPPVTTKDWMDKIHADLKGADFNKKLVWKTAEGLEVNPFYRSEDIEKLTYINSLPGEFPYIRGTRINNNNWLIRQNIVVQDYAAANKKALDILMKGVDSLGFIIADPETVNESNFNLLLRDIHLESIETNFHANGKAKEILAVLIGIVAERGLDFSRVRGAIETDPLSRLMVNGTLCIPEEEGFDYLSALTVDSAVLPNLRTIHLNASNFNNAGADIVQELAFGISMGCEYLSRLTARGISAVEAAAKIRFSFGVGSGYFTEIAKLRAARLLWSAVTNGFAPGNSDTIKMDIHSVTSEWNKTLYDPYVNMLRTQTEAMSAILGGTDSLTVEPFDIAFREPDEFSERIARNQQLILKEESYFDKVADPSAGSYYIENLTALIAEHAWKLFVRTEENGGFLASLHSGFIQSSLAESSAKKKADVASRKTIFVGTNQYPDPAETLSDHVDFNIAFRGKQEVSGTDIDPIRFFRGSEEFERLRAAVGRASKRPSVFLMKIGNPLMRKARAQFSSGFFGCAGYRIIDNPGFSSVEEGIKSFLETDAVIIVLCSSDEEYIMYAPEVLTQLKDKAIIVVAGNPSSAGELKAIGIDLFIHLKSDVPAMLAYFNEKLGIKE